MIVSGWSLVVLQGQREQHKTQVALFTVEDEAGREEVNRFSLAPLSCGLLLSYPVLTSSKHPV